MSRVDNQPSHSSLYTATRVILKGESDASFLIETLSSRERKRSFILFFLKILPHQVITKIKHNNRYFVPLDVMNRKYHITEEFCPCLGIKSNMNLTKPLDLTISLLETEVTEDHSIELRREALSIMLGP